MLSREGAEVALIPRYFDLLMLLVRRREEAVARRDIMDAVWSDVVVSDGALSQAVRSLRRALGDDPREPVYIRTVSRHGYRFVCSDVVEQPDTADVVRPPSQETAAAWQGGLGPQGAGDPMEGALLRLLAVNGPAPEGLADPERREAAETLHALGTAEALRRLDHRPGHAAARAILRDARWDVAGAGEVPLLGAPGALLAAWVLVRLRLARALRAVAARWAAASLGGALAGLLGGLIGGTALWLAPGATAPSSLLVVLALVGAGIGGLGAAGVGAGLAVAEALARSRRDASLVLCGALGGGFVGAVSHLLGRWMLEGLFGQTLAPVGNGLEGLGLGAAAGLGYALATPRPEGGMATPHGARRALAVALTGLSCALMALMLTGLGRNLGGASLNTLARAFSGSQVGLAPVARLLGEAEMGPRTRGVIAGCEGLLFGCGLALGLTRRPR